LKILIFNKISKNKNIKIMKLIVRLQIYLNKEKNGIVLIHFSGDFAKYIKIPSKNIK
jgi:hypothetical protein